MLVGLLDCFVTFGDVRFDPAAVFGNADGHDARSRDCCQANWSREDGLRRFAHRGLRLREPSKQPPTQFATCQDRVGPDVADRIGAIHAT
jgi:hypothetical protein